MGMKIDRTQVFGFEGAIRGMRNPMDSWHLTDSEVNFSATPNENREGFEFGEKDLGLAQRLINGGSEHCKFLRQIQVWCDMDMPRYWWSEMDTYKFNTKNSCSTMHKLFNKKKGITLDQFVFNEEDREIMLMMVAHLNKIREEWLTASDNKDGKEQIKCLTRAKRILSEGLLQKRTVNTNYAELRNIYIQRRHHRLKEEWVEVFCGWVNNLPYAKELITFGLE